MLRNSGPRFTKGRKS